MTLNKTTLLVWRDITRNEHCLVHWLDILIERSVGAICCVIISTTHRKATQACFLCNAKVFSLKWHLRVTHSLCRHTWETRKPSSACPFCGRAYRLLSEFLLHLYKRHPKKSWVTHCMLNIELLPLTKQRLIYNFVKALFLWRKTESPAYPCYKAYYNCAEDSPKWHKTLGVLIDLLSVVAEEWPTTDKKWNTKILH